MTAPSRSSFTPAGMCIPAYGNAPSLFPSSANRILPPILSLNSFPFSVFSVVSSFPLFLPANALVFLRGLRVSVVNGVSL